jgi:hypothetical protein
VTAKIIPFPPVPEHQDTRVADQVAAAVAAAGGAPVATMLILLELVRSQIAEDKPQSLFMVYDVLDGKQHEYKYLNFSFTTGTLQAAIDRVKKVMDAPDKVG